MGSSSGRPVLGPQDGSGIPQHLFMGFLLRYCADCEEALAFARKHPVAGKGIIVGLTDREGRMLRIETCGRHLGFAWGRDYVFSVNHYQDPAMFEEIRKQVPGFLTSDYYANSNARREFLQRHLPRMVGTPLSREDQVAELFADELGTVCQRGVVGREPKAMWTNYGALCDPVARTMDVYWGLPCDNQVTRYTL